MKRARHVSQFVDLVTPLVYFLYSTMLVVTLRTHAPTFPCGPLSFSSCIRTSYGYSLFPLFTFVYIYDTDTSDRVDTHVTTPNVLERVPLSAVMTT